MGLWVNEITNASLTPNDTARGVKSNKYVEIFIVKMRRTTGSYLNQRYYFVKGQAWTGKRHRIESELSPASLTLEHYSKYYISVFQMYCIDRIIFIYIYK